MHATLTCKSDGFKVFKVQHLFVRMYENVRGGKYCDETKIQH